MFIDSKSDGWTGSVSLLEETIATHHEMEKDCGANLVDRQSMHNEVSKEFFYIFVLRRKHSNLGGNGTIRDYTPKVEFFFKTAIICESEFRCLSVVWFVADPSDYLQCWCEEGRLSLKPQRPYLEEGNLYFEGQAEN